MPCDTNQRFCLGCKHVRYLHLTLATGDRGGRHHVAPDRDIVVDSYDACDDLLVHSPMDR